MAEAQIIPTESIRGDGLNANVLIFRQLERVNYMFSQVLVSNPEFRKEAMLGVFHAIRGLETIMWARLGRDAQYLKRRKDLKINEPETFELLKGGNLKGQMDFSSVMDKWFKSIAWRLDRFNFYPPIDLYDFTSLDDLIKAEAEAETII